MNILCEIGLCLCCLTVICNQLRTLEKEPATVRTIWTLIFDHQIFIGMDQKLSSAKWTVVWIQPNGYINWSMASQLQPLNTREIALLFIGGVIYFCLCILVIDFPLGAYTHPSFYSDTDPILRHVWIWSGLYCNIFIYMKKRMFYSTLQRFNTAFIWLNFVWQ